MKVLTAFVIGCIAGLAPLATADAYIIQLSSASVVPGGGITDASGTPLSNAGFTAKYGFFTSDGTLSGTVLSVGDLQGLVPGSPGVAPLTSTLDAMFVEVGSSSSFNDQSGVQGTFSDLVDIADSANGGGVPFTFSEYTTSIANKPVFGYFLKDDGSEAAVFQSLTVGTLSPVTFVSGIDDLNALTSAGFLSSQVDVAFGGLMGPSLFPGSGNTLQLVATIPEPAGGLLLAMSGALCLLLRRRV